MKPMKDLISGTSAIAAVCGAASAQQNQVAPGRVYTFHSGGQGGCSTGMWYSNHMRADRPRR